MASRKPPPKLATAGIVIWAAGAFALQLGLAPSDPVAARSYNLTLGVITFAGFVMTVVGGIRWWRAKRDTE